MLDNLGKKLTLMFTVASTLSLRCYADQASDKVFAKLDVQAKEQWHQKPPLDANEQRTESIKNGNLLKADVRDLTPRQLVALIKRCRQKIHEIPSDSKHERYFDYFEQAISFSLRRLGELDTAPARQALDEVKPIISGTSSLMLTWDEVKAKQKTK